MAQKSSRPRPPPQPVYDDATIENMVHYYGLKDEESLFKYIKSRGLQAQDQ